VGHFLQSIHIHDHAAHVAEWCTDNAMEGWSGGSHLLRQTHHSSMSLYVSCPAIVRYEAELSEFDETILL
jgi:hypothetical protein